MSVPTRELPDGERRPDLTRRGFLRATVAAAGGLLLAGPGAPTDGEPLPAGLGGESGFAGVVADLLTGQPISGATVSAEPSGAAALTDRAGAYRLDLPPGTYRLTARHPAYVELTYTQKTISPGLVAVADFGLVRPGLSRGEEEAVYAKLGLQVEAPLPEPGLAVAEQVQAVSLPQYIVVRHEYSPGVYTDTQVPLEDYVKGVVPNEVPSTWPAEALKAQAVAARSYGVVSFLSRGYVYDDTRSQVYNPDNRTASTDAAVDATRSVVVTYGSSIAQTFFYSRCNGVTTRNSEDAIYWQSCTRANWAYVGYCRARPCGGHDVFQHACADPGMSNYVGHGVGLCQWGAWARANESFTYQAILAHYYTGIGLAWTAVPLAPGNGAFFLPGEVITLRWSGDGTAYNLELTGAPPIRTTDTSYVLVAGSLGLYQWRVQADYGGGSTSVWSPYQSFRVVSQRFRTQFPIVRR